jgi:anti-sigma factor RsiW
MSACSQVTPLFDAFLDGQLPSDRAVEVEEHLARCTRCQEHLAFTEALRRSLRRVVRADAVPSEAFRQRLEDALAAERQREDEADDQPDGLPRMARWGLSLAAAAALIVLAVSVDRLKGARGGVELPVRNEPTLHASATETSSISAMVEALLDELVQAHARPPAPQILEPTLIEDLEPEVGVPVRLPSLSTYGASWEGGSVIPMRNHHRAARLRYRLSNHPVTVYIYDARRVPLRAILETRVVRNVPVHVGAHRGYSVAAREERGLGYAVATDLTSDESAELVAAIH